MFALTKHIAHKMAIAGNYILKKTSINFNKRQFKTNESLMKLNAHWALTVYPVLKDQSLKKV